MSEHFLEEQLKRIRQMSERMSEQMTRLRNSAAESSEAFERDRVAGKHDPLHEIRDFRRPPSMQPQRDRPDEHARRQHPRHTARSRRK